MRPADDHPFLSGGGKAARIILRFDWAKTPLGPIATWPECQKTAIAMILRSPVPMCTLWGEDGIMIYNDAYADFAGARHPGLFGRRAREGWSEVADFIDNVLKVGLAGGTLAFRDQELKLYRNGAPESVWLNLDYSPLLDEDGEPTGVMAIVVETTAKVRAERELNAERQRLWRLFEQAPGFMAVLNGPEHRFAMVNEAYYALVGHRNVLGKSVCEALPELAGQGFMDLLDRVYRTNEPYVGHAMEVELKHGRGQQVEKRYLDFLYQPIVEDGGRVTGVFVQGNDVTDQKLTEFQLRESEERFRLVAENAPVMLWMGNREGDCV